MKNLVEIWSEVQKDLNSNSKSALESQSDVEFLRQLENSIAEDLWKSFGGHWSEANIEFFRWEAIRKLSASINSGQTIAQAWIEVVRDFHSSSKHDGVWGQKPLPKKEKLPLTEDQKNSRKLFMYIWAMMQTAIVTKTAIFYFGLKSAEEGTSEGKVYVTLAILTTLVSLTFFAFRNYKDE